MKFTLVFLAGILTLASSVLANPILNELEMMRRSSTLFPSCIPPIIGRRAPEWARARGLPLCPAEPLLTPGSFSLVNEAKRELLERAQTFPNCIPLAIGRRAPEWARGLPFCPEQFVSTLPESIFTGSKRFDLSALCLLDRADGSRVLKRCEGPPPRPVINIPGVGNVTIGSNII